MGKWIGHDQQLQIMAIVFKRSTTSHWEYGIQLNNDGLIIDMDGKVVRQPVNAMVQRMLDFSVTYRPME